MRLPPHLGRSPAPTLLVSLALALAPTIASAQTRAETQAAERAFDEAMALMDAGRYREACPKLEASDRLAPASGTLLNLADCYEHVGRLGSAWKAFEAAAARASQSGKRERERVARERAALLAPRLSRLLLVSPPNLPAGLSLTLDGAALPPPAWGTPIVVDPGAHALLARAPGRQSFATTLTAIAEGATFTFQIPNLADDRASPSTATASGPGGRGLDAQRLGAVVSAGVGVAGFVAGTAFGLHSIAKHDESDAHCDGSICRDPRGVSAMQDARTAGDRATVGFIVGGVGLAAASLLWFVRPFSSAPAPQTQVGVGASGVVLRGRF
jgi:hypothetical protein